MKPRSKTSKKSQTRRKKRSPQSPRGMAKQRGGYVTKVFTMKEVAEILGEHYFGYTDEAEVYEILNSILELDNPDWSEIHKQKITYNDFFAIFKLFNMLIKDNYAEYMNKGLLQGNVLNTDNEIRAILDASGKGMNAINLNNNNNNNNSNTSNNN